MSAPRAGRGLGRGLDALLPVKPSEVPSPAGGGSYGAGDVFRCAVEKIFPQPGQPRRHFDGEALEQLAASLREHGLIEPLVVRRRPNKADEFELIAGERRWRAAQRAGLREVLVVVRDVSARDAFELALVENVQRADLNPIEFAEALQRLVDEHGFTQERLAARVGRERSTLANALRLLKLPPRVRERVITGQLSEGHARALLAAPEGQLEELAARVVKQRLNVRQTEALVRAAKGAAGPPAPAGKSVATRDLERRFEKKLGARVEVLDKAGKGEVRIKYGSLDELDRIIAVIL